MLGGFIFAKFTEKCYNKSKIESEFVVEIIFEEDSCNLFSRRRKYDS